MHEQLWQQNTLLSHQDFYNVLSYAIDVVAAENEANKKNAFKNFIDIFEAIVAYHKAAEKK